MSVGVAVDNDELERLLAVRALGAIGNAVTPELDSLVSLARDMFDVPYAAANIIDEDWQCAASQSGLLLTRCSRTDSVCTHVVHARELLVVADLMADHRFAANPAVVGHPHFRFYAGAPMQLDEGAVVGAFCILDTKPRNFSPEQVESLRRFASVASGLLRLHRNQLIMSLAEDELRKAAMTDPLTGLYNRSALTALVDRALGTSLTAGRRFGVLAMDMDGFKAINDRLGHHAGDTVLREASHRIRAALRAEDIAVRMGGDEFAIFVPGVPSMQVLTDVGERLLQSFRAPFEADGVCVSAKISIGAALAPESARDRQELLRVVDAALYEAKTSGRDCLRVAGQLF